ncbi:hypothetical protein [Wukongibacter sp. M2B1]|uniref:hypothetical protein n=1 Tax=Wukongibacter sp. M2B1 TaxID=3088895 RepID=UPI003D7B0FA9
MGSNRANDNTVIMIQTIFDHINNFEYAEAFLVSSEIMERNEQGDQLFHEWVKSLTEFFTCNKRYEAISLLERIKPDVIENEIHFRIINSLVDFYREVEDEENFLKYKNKIYPEISKLKNTELKHKIVYNIANGFYTFQNYKEALRYIEESIDIARENNLFTIFYSLCFMVKIMCLFYLDEPEKADDLKSVFESYLDIIGNLKHKEYLEKAIRRFQERRITNE